MTVKIDSYPYAYTDLTARFEFARRVRELEELAREEGLRLPIPATWIATLESLGYVVDLRALTWEDADEVRLWPTDAARVALDMLKEGEHNGTD